VESCALTEISICAELHRLLQGSLVLENGDDLEEVSEQLAMMQCKPKIAKGSTKPKDKTSSERNAKQSTGKRRRGINASTGAKNKKARRSTASPDRDDDGSMPLVSVSGSSISGNADNSDRNSLVVNTTNIEKVENIDSNAGMFSTLLLRIGADMTLNDYLGEDTASNSSLATIASDVPARSSPSLTDLAGDCQMQSGIFSNCDVDRILIIVQEHNSDNANVLIPSSSLQQLSLSHSQLISSFPPII
jgi:hypothetical protein